MIEHLFFVDGINEESSGSWIISKDYEALISSLKKLDTNAYDTYDVNRKDSSGRTTLMLLCSKNDVIVGDQIKLRDYVYKFLDLPSVDEKFINAEDSNGNTALALLCEHYNGEDLIDILRLFIRKGASINQVTAKNGFNALMLLCMQYSHGNLIDIIKLFIENCVDINTKGADDAWNVLHILCRYYNSDELIRIIVLLIDHGIELDAATTKKGWNVLHILCLFYTGEHMLEMIRLFLEKGININHRSSAGLNALAYFAGFYNRNDLIDIMGLLIEKDSSVLQCVPINNDESHCPNPLVIACSQDYVRTGSNDLIDIIRLLIDYGVDVNNKMKDGWNALLSVCRHYRHANLIEIVQLLVSCGIDIHWKTNQGSNALLCICANDNLNHGICLDVFRLLLINLKCDVNAVNQVDSDNALILLCKRHHNCDKLIDIIRLILDHTDTIDVNHKNKNGETAMSILRSKGRLVKNSSAIIEILSKHGAQA